MSEVKTKAKKEERLLGVYTSLMNGEIIDGEEVAERYGCNIKTIRRDFEDIENFLADYNLETGSRYEVKNIEESRRDKAKYQLINRDGGYMNRQELLAVCKILMDSRSLAHSEMAPIMEKLVGTAVQTHDRKFVSDLLANEWFNYVEPSHKTEILDSLLEISRAVKEQRVIRIGYTKKGGELVQRDLEPLGIIFSENYFYLAGNLRDFDKQNFHIKGDENPTMYRVDRIDELEVLDDRYQIAEAKRFKEGEYRKRIQFMFGGALYHLKFYVKSFALEFLKDKLGMAKVSDCPDPDYDYQVEAEMFGQGILMWLMGQGDGIKLVEPQELVDKMREKAEKLCQLYTGSEN